MLRCSSVLLAHRRHRRLWIRVGFSFARKPALAVQRLTRNLHCLWPGCAEAFEAVGILYIALVLRNDVLVK